MQDNDPNSFKSTYEILEQIAEVIEELNDTEASELVQLMFGKSRANQGMAILQAFQSGQVQKAFEAANNAENSAINEHEKWLNSLDAKIAQLKAAGQSFSLEFLDTKLVKGATDALTGLLNIITKIMSKISSIPVIFTGIVSSLAMIKNAGIFGVIDGNAKGFANKFGMLGESFSTFGKNYNTNAMNINGYFKRFRSFNGAIADTYFRAGITDADSEALRQYAEGIVNTNEKHKVFNATMANTSKIAQKQVAVINNLNAQRAAGTITLEEYNLRVNAVTQATNKLSFAQKMLNGVAKIGITIVNTFVNMAISFAISTLIALIVKVALSSKEATEKIKDVGQAARETTKSISELHSEYLNLNIAVENGTASKEDLTSKTNELLTALGYEGIAVSELIEKYGSLDNAINQLSYDSLQEAHGGLVASVNEYKNELLKAGDDWSASKWGNANTFSLKIEDTEDFKKIKNILDKNGLTSYLQQGHNGRDSSYSYYLNGDTSTIEGIKENYETLLEIRKEFVLAFGSDIAGDFDIFKNISNRLEQIKEPYENYINEVNALNKNAAQQSIISSLMGKELPKTQEEYDRFYNSLIAKATEANSEMRMQFIGSNEEIVDVIDAALRNMTVFKDFTVEDIPVEVSILPTVTVKVDALKSKLDEAKEKITEAIKNATLFDTAANTVNAETPISFDDVLTLVNLDGTLADKFTKTANGYTIAAEELTAAKERYIQATKDSLNESIKVANDTISDAENNIANMETRIQELKTDNYSINSPYDYQRAQTEIADLADTIEIERQNIDKANGVISENKLLLGELSDKLSKDLAPSLKNIENHVNLTKSAMTDMRDSGQISASTYDSIISAGKNYSECLEIQNGKLVVNIQKLKELQQQELKNEIAEVRFAKASWETVMATKSMAGEDTSAIAKKIRELNLQEAALNTAIEEIGNAKPEDKENEKPKQVTDFEKELAEKQHLVAMKELSEEDYLNWLDGAYKKAYAGLKDYDDDLYKYQEEIFSKRRELAEKSFNDINESIEKEIESLEKLKENATLEADADGNIYSIIDQQIELYKQEVVNIKNRIAELEASGLIGIEDEIEELNTKREDLLDKIYDLSKERTSTGLENEISYWEEMQSKQNDFYDKQIEQLKKQKELLEDKNEEEEKAKDLAEKQLNLRKAEIALEDARRNRNVLVYTAGGGYSYEADQTAIAEAEEDVKKAREELAELKENEIKESLDKQIETLEDQKDKDSKYYDTVIKLLEDMSGKNKVQSESNLAIWDQLLATDAGQSAVAKIDPKILSGLLDSGFLVKNNGRFEIGGSSKLPVMSAADVIAFVGKAIGAVNETHTSAGYDQTSLNVQAAANERNSAIKSSVFNNSNVSQISISQVDVKYAGESVDSFATALLGAVGNKVITLTNQKLSNAT